MKTILLSGGFDPLHVGHVEYIEKAWEFGKIVIALNSDDWLIRKKGSFFMPFEERKKILLALKWVDNVVSVDDSDDTVCEAIKEIKPDFFAKGGDRGKHNTPEQVLCQELDIPIIFGLGDKIQSSSLLVKKHWGHYEVIHESPLCKVKILTLLPGKKTSVQSHFKRNEHWVFPESNEYKFVQKTEIHQLENKGDKSLTVIEVQTGEAFIESDIVRYE